MDLDAYFAENPMGGSFPTNPDFKSGFVTLVGRPNAGKSTLLNTIMGKKIAITSNTAQTTRHRFRAVHTTDDMQMIIVDTPGLHKPQDALGEELNTSAIKPLSGKCCACTGISTLSAAVSAPIVSIPSDGIQSIRQ